MGLGGAFRTLGMSVAALLLVLLGAGPVSAAPGCSVSAAPSTGAAGTVFKFTGHDFEPTELRLRKNGTDAGEHSLAVTDDPWTVTVRSRPGDEGAWSAEFSSSDCTAIAGFTVTLSNTDALDPSAPALPAQLPLGLAALVIATGAGGGIVLGKRLRTAPADNSNSTL